MKKKKTDTEIENFIYNVDWLKSFHSLSRKEMAEIMGISIENFNMIENGEIPPDVSVEVVFNISKLFGIKPKDLFGQRLE